MCFEYRQQWCSSAIAFSTAFSLKLRRWLTSPVQVVLHWNFVVQDPYFVMIVSFRVAPPIGQHACVFSASVSMQPRLWLALETYSLILLRLSLVAWLVHQACTCAFRRRFFSFAGDCTRSLRLLLSVLPSVFPDVCCVRKMLRHTLFACLPLSLVSRGDTRLGFLRCCGSTCVH